VDLWELYNMMTQLGGFETVAANLWWFVFTKDRPSWAAMRGSVMRLKGIYRHYLLPFERVHFHGKRYNTPDQVMLLWRDPAAGPLGGPAPAHTAAAAAPGPDPAAAAAAAGAVPDTAPAAAATSSAPRSYPSPPSVISARGRRPLQPPGADRDAEAEGDVPPLEPIPGRIQSAGALGWVACGRCGQWSTVEAGNPIPIPADWRCTRNRWNPGLAYCQTEEEFTEAFAAWWRGQRHPTGEEGDTVPAVTLGGERVNFWYAHNVVTQLGGWRTVCGNGWVAALYGSTPAWANSYSIGHRLKQVYLRFLWGYEKETFKGKRYDTAEEGAKLWRRGGPLGLGEGVGDDSRDRDGDGGSKRPRDDDMADAPAPKERKADAAAVRWGALVEVGSRVWVRTEEDGGWCPGRVVLDPGPPSPDRDVRDLRSTGDGPPTPSVFVRLYGDPAAPCRSAPAHYRRDLIHPWEYDIERKTLAASTTPALDLAVRGRVFLFL